MNLGGYRLRQLPGNGPNNEAVRDRAWDKHLSR